MNVLAIFTYEFWFSMCVGTQKDIQLPLSISSRRRTSEYLGPQNESDIRVASVRVRSHRLKQITPTMTLNFLASLYSSAPLPETIFYGGVTCRTI